MIGEASGAPGRRLVNVTASEALLSVGPLTLLHVMQLCSAASGPSTEEAEAGGSNVGNDILTAVAAAVQRARERGTLTIHIVGVVQDLEPMMSWDRYLMGNLTARERYLVSAFGLPVAPFAGAEVHIEFIMNELGTIRPRRGPFMPGYSENHSTGLYHEIISPASPPDLVLALNPGFAHYPALWWPTLRALRRASAPVIATGYGPNMNNVYEFSEHAMPDVLDDASLAVPVAVPSERPASSGAYSYYAPDGAPFPVTRPKKVDTYNIPNGLMWKHQFFSESDEALPESWRPPYATSGSCSAANRRQAINVTGACSDTNGIKYMGSRAGFDVEMATRLPFRYCDQPARGQCNSNGVAVILAPRADAGSDDTVPKRLFNEAVGKMLPCLQDYTALSDAVVRCLERKASGDGLIHTMITGMPGEEAGSMFPGRQPGTVDEFLAAAVNTCKKELVDVGA